MRFWAHKMQLLFVNGSAIQEDKMKTLMLRFWKWMFGCHHQRMSWPITLDNRTYEVCCDCGAEFDYSWEMMAVQHPATSATPRHKWRTRASSMPVARKSRHGSKDCERPESDASCLQLGEGNPHYRLNMFPLFLISHPSHFSCTHQA
jgi:hypothetical protein